MDIQIIIRREQKDTLVIGREPLARKQVAPVLRNVSHII
jgi:hypothetical protein